MQPSPPRRNSRRPKRPTRCSPTRKKGRAYDQYGHAGQTPTCAAPGWGRRVWRLCRGVWRHLRRHVRPAGRTPGRRWPPGYRGSDPQLRHGDHAGRSSAARMRKPYPVLGFVRHLPRQRCCQAPAPRPAAPARALARCRCARASSACSKPARIAAASGKIIPEPCTACHGQGKIKKQKTLEVKIPAGIDDGMRIRSTGNGEPGTNGRPTGRPVHRNPHQEARHLRARWR